MSDFFQTGAIATLHRLGRTDVTRLEKELNAFAEDTPIVAQTRAAMENSRAIIIISCK